MLIFVVQYYYCYSMVFFFDLHYLSFIYFRAKENTKLYEAAKLNHNIFSIVRETREKIFLL